MYRERHEAAMKYSQENDEFYEKECDKLESERDAARLEKTRYFVIFNRRSLSCWFFLIEKFGGEACFEVSFITT